MPLLSSFQGKCVALLNTAPRTHAAHCFKSAISHLERAELLREVDPAMAMFRAITAEEEAASGVLRCLIEMGYAASSELNVHDHVQKHAVFPFLQVIGLFFDQTFSDHFTGYKLHITEENGTSRLMLALEVKVDGGLELGYPIPPFNFDIKNPSTGDAPDFTLEINQLVKAKGKATIKEFLKQEANLRNEILYAGPAGYLVISVLNTDFLAERKKRVLVMINLYLMLFPYPERQPFVTQALTSFLKILPQLKRSRISN